MLRSSLLLCALAVVTGCNDAPEAGVAHIEPAEPVTGDDLTLVIDAAPADPNKNDDVAVEIRWSVDGEVVDALTTETVPAAQTQKGQVWEATIVGNDGKLDGEATTVSVTIGNTAPVAENVAITPGTPETTDALTASATGTDADADAVTVEFVWQVNGTAVATQGETLDPSETTKGDQVTVIATPFDGETYGEPVESAAITIGNAAPSVESATVSPAEAREADTLTCVAAGWADADGDAESYETTWTVGGVEIVQAELTGADFDKNDSVSCSLRPFDGEDYGTSVASAAITILNTPPVADAVSIDPGTVTVEDIASVLYDPAVDDDGDALTYAVAWTVNGVAAGSEENLDLAGFSRGDSVIATLTPSDDEEAGTPAVSAAVIIGNSLPVITSVTTSPSDVRTDDSLTASYAATDADGDRVSVTWSWSVNGGAITETSDTLDGTSWFSKGDTLVATATPNDGVDDGLPVSSVAVTVSNTAPTAPVLAASGSDADTDLQCVIATASTDADADKLTYSFLWEKDGVAWTGGTVTTTYAGDTIDAADLEDGQVWTCDVEVSDGTDTAAASLEMLVGVGCLDGTVEVEWSDDVHGCAGPDQYWRDYDADIASYCAPGWTMAGASIVNTVLTGPGYTADVKYAFDGEGCDGHDQFATRYNSYSQSRSGCGWSTSHHWSLGSSSTHTGSSYELQGIVCERE